MEAAHSPHATTSESLASISSDWRRRLAFCLRLLAILQGLTGLITFVPNAWLAEWHAWLGLGWLPLDPVLLYCLRGGAIVQFAIGVLIWITASDVVRYRPMAIATGAIFAVSGPAFFVMERLAGMPLFWCQFDGLACFLTGAVLLVLCRLASDRRAV